MEKEHKILFSILSMLFFIAIISIISISINISKKEKHANNAANLLGTKAGVGIVRIVGAIESTYGPENPFGGSGGGSDQVIKRLDEFDKDSKIKAIVIRIDSPGGTVGAVQEIYDKVMKIRQKDEKVIIASMGNMAASGGYYIASACNVIFANRGTLTGSIGVITMSPNLRGLFKKLGIDMNVIKSGKYKDILSAYRDMTPQERKFLQDMIDISYKQFLVDVAAGRNVKISKIKPYADGRIYNGSTAQKIGLVDELGSLEDALLYAKKIAKLDEAAPVYESEGTQLEQFFSQITGSVATKGTKETFTKIPMMNLIQYRCCYEF